tara:strand:+ start:620 stop:1258 length:639 start_codon:yes stop_codon:yes gene_type:complete
MNIFVISLGGERLKRINYDYTLIEGDNWVNINPMIKEKMVRKHNETEKHFLSKCGCFSSHYKTFKYIVENKINNVIICEDDAILDSPIPLEDLDFGSKAIVLGAKLDHPTNYREPFSPTTIASQFHVGLNKIDKNKYRWSMTFSIYYGDWRLIKLLVDLIEKPNTKLNHMDLWLCKTGLIEFLHYPSIFTHNDGGDSCYGKKRKIFKNYIGK